LDFKEFGKLISIYRKKQKISQETLAKDLNISRATLSAFENSSGVDIGIRKVFQIVDYLGFEITLHEKSSFPSFEEIRDEK